MTWHLIADAIRRQIILRMLVKDPTKRPLSSVLYTDLTALATELRLADEAAAKELSDAIARRLSSEEPVSSRPTSPARFGRDPMDVGSVAYLARTLSPLPSPLPSPTKTPVSLAPPFTLKRDSGDLLAASIRIARAASSSHNSSTSIFVHVDKHVLQSAGHVEPLPVAPTAVQPARPASLPSDAPPIRSALKTPRASSENLLADTSVAVGSQPPFQKPQLKRAVSFVEPIRETGEVAAESDRDSPGSTPTVPQATPEPPVVLSPAAAQAARRQTAQEMLRNLHRSAAGLPPK